MGEKWIIAAPSANKAKIIMNYVIKHVFDNVVLQSQLEMDSSEKLKKETSKKRITFKTGGEVEILTLDSRNSKKNTEAAMGHGAPNVILDESSMIGDALYATVKRMLGGHNPNFLLEIGNPFYRNHFHRTWEYDDTYNKVFIDYHMALEEGRFTPEFIDEMRKEAFFDVFYECTFPNENAIIDGYRQLITSDQVKIKKPDDKVANPTHMGIDVGAGGDYTIVTIRGAKRAETALKMQVKDTMAQVGVLAEIIDKYKMIPRQQIFIDDVGIGRGVSDRLKELGYDITPVSAGARAKEPKKFYNRKAEMAKHMADWVIQGGEVDKETGMQLTWYRYDTSSEKQMKMEKKEDMVQRTGKSPDYGDALMLTFDQKPMVTVSKYRPKGL